MLCVESMNASNVGYAHTYVKGKMEKMFIMILFLNFFSLEGQECNIFERLRATIQSLLN